MWAFTPALIAVVTVFIFRDVIASLFIGIITGVLIYTIGIKAGLREFLDLLFTALFKSAAQNIPLITFILMLGSLVTVITMSGGHLAYGRWAAKKIKSSRGVSLAVIALGMMIFIDDYFSCLLTGAVMRPAADRYKMSREKLAYFIDSTAAPVCILAPVSSWTMTIAEIVENAEMGNGLLLFIRSIPWNFYAIFSLLFVLYIALTRRDFSYMRNYEHESGSFQGKQGRLYGTEREINEKTASEKGTLIDLILPNLAVISLTLLSIAWLGGLFGPEQVSIVEAYTRADTAMAINFGCLGALTLCFLLYIPRRLLSVRQFFEGAAEGMKSMFTAVIILIMAWTMSAITTESLGAASYVESAMERVQGTVDFSFLPLAIFLFSALVSFGLGSWGTFLVTIPFIAVIAKAVDASLFSLYLASTLAGSVFGDHASPITDTTILASIGARCDHIGHVKTQLPYALLVCLGSAAAFGCMGYTGNTLASYSAGLIAITAALLLIYRIERNKTNG
jgi:Na+/H+ antiporter NhaC